MKKNITLSADDSLIYRARKRAMAEHTSLNEAFRNWLESYASVSEAAGEYDRLMDDLEDADSGQKFTRGELNER